MTRPEARRAPVGTGDFLYQTPPGDERKVRKMSFPKTHTHLVQQLHVGK